MDNFLQSLDELQEFLEKGIIEEILYVTDTGFLNNSCKSLLKSKNVTLLEKESLTDKYLEKFDQHIRERDIGCRPVSRGQRGGTIWRQLYDLDYALKHVPENAHFFRTRTDVHIDRAFLYELFTNRKLTEKTSHGNIFEEKIWVQWCAAAYPFYIQDTAFYGKRHDIRKLVSESINLELAKYYPASCLPVFFWVLPFLNESENIRIWMEKYSSEPFSTKLLYDDQYLRILYEYYQILDDYFFIYFPQMRHMYQWASGLYSNRTWKRVSDMKSLSGILDQYKPNDKLRVFETNRFVNEIVTGMRDSDPLVSRMRATGLEEHLANLESGERHAYKSFSYARTRGNAVFNRIYKDTLIAKSKYAARVLKAKARKMFAIQKCSKNDRNQGL